VVSYTATRWGNLCDPRKTPPGERTPSGTDCYRFALSNPSVDLCLSGPDDAEQMKQALEALEAGPMGEDELAWMRRVGDHIYANASGASILDGK
jgi:predicted aldo/keto reductase-like oxidoreductase